MNITIIRKAQRTEPDEPISRELCGYTIDHIFEPPRTTRRGLTTALRSMEIGESVLVPHEQRTSIGPTTRNLRPALFTQRTQDNGIRVWRIE